MFASRSFGALQSGDSLDVPVAALAGLAVAFLAFSAPADLLANLVGSTGLPSILPAAEPPLGLKARIALGAGGAAAVFAIALLLLRWLGHFGAGRAEQADTATELEVPRLRRRDIHPDAPARPPLLAVHELGEPELELDQVEPEPLAAWDEQPALLARKPDREADPEPYSPESFEPDPPVEEAPAYTPPAEEAPNDQAGAYALSQRNWTDFEPEPQAEAEPDQPWVAEPVFETEPKWETRSSSPQPWPAEEADAVEPERPESPQSEWAAEPTPEAEPQWGQPAAPAEPWPAPQPVSIEPDPSVPELEPDPEFEPEHEFEPMAELEPEPEPESQPEPQAEPVPELETFQAAPPPPSGSIAELMERLEKGLARHRVAPEPAASKPTIAPVAQVAPARPISPDPADDRLQNAIESLQRFASRQD